MARLGKRERLAKQQRDFLAYAQGIRARAVQGERSLTRGNFDNLFPNGKSRPDWSWNWRHERRIKNNGKWV